MIQSSVESTHEAQSSVTKTILVWPTSESKRARWHLMESIGEFMIEASKLRHRQSLKAHKTKLFFRRIILSVSQLSWGFFFCRRYAWSDGAFSLNQEVTCWSCFCRSLQIHFSPSTVVMSKNRSPRGKVKWGSWQSSPAHIPQPLPIWTPRVRRVNQFPSGQEHSIWVMMTINFRVLRWINDGKLSMIARQLDGICIQFALLALKGERKLLTEATGGSLGWCELLLMIPLLGFICMRALIFPLFVSLLHANTKRFSRAAMKFDYARHKSLGSSFLIHIEQNYLSKTFWVNFGTTNRRRNVRKASSPLFVGYEAWC